MIRECNSISDFFIHANDFLLQYEALNNHIIDALQVAMHSNNTDGVLSVISYDRESEGLFVLFSDGKLYLSNPFSSLAQADLMKKLDESNLSVTKVTGSNQVVESFLDAWNEYKKSDVKLIYDADFFQLSHSVTLSVSEGEVRRATLEDLNEVLNMRISFLKDTGSVKDSDALANLKSIMERWIQKNEVYFWLVEGNVTSLIVIFELLNKFVRIGSVYTLPKYRGKGYVSSLIAKVADEKLREGKNCVLSALKSEPNIIQLYQRLGFEKISTVCCYQLT